MKAFECPRCNHKSFRRLKRNKWQKLLPSFKKYECSNCYYRYYTFAKILFKPKQ